MDYRCSKRRQSCKIQGLNLLITFHEVDKKQLKLLWDCYNCTRAPSGCCLCITAEELLFSHFSYITSHSRCSTASKQKPGATKDRLQCSKLSGQFLLFLKALACSQLQVGNLTKHVELSYSTYLFYLPAMFKNHTQIYN